MMEDKKQEPVAYINIEKRRLEWAHDYMSWDTPTVVNLPRIPLYTTPPQRKPLTQEQIDSIPLKNLNKYNTTVAKKYLVRTVEAMHNIKE